MINIENVTFGYSQKPIFEELSLSIAFSPQSRVIALVGPNGCGKSTLLRIVAGHLKTKTGRVTVFDKELKHISPKEKSKILGMIQQNVKLDFPFSCFDTVLMGRYAHKGEFEDYRPEDIQISLKALEEVELEHLVDQQITHVSGGEFQRVLIARTIAQGPKLILLDEAFSAMDIRHKQHAIELLKVYAEREDAYILMVLHDINFAYKYSDGVIMMKNGEIMHRGRTHETLNEETIYSVFDVHMKQIENEGFLLI